MGTFTNTWSTHGTYYLTLPFGVDSIDIECWGGGGAGGDTNFGTVGSGGGGGGRSEFEMFKEGSGKTVKIFFFEEVVQPVNISVIKQINKMKLNCCLFIRSFLLIYKRSKS